MTSVNQSSLLAGVVVAAATAFACTSAQAAVPFTVEGHTYVLEGTMKVGGKARCGAFGGGGGAKSKVPLGASIRFDPDDAFFWFDDSTALADSYGQIIKRNKNGKKLELAFNGGQAATALFQMANIPNNGNPTGVDIASSYSLKAAVSPQKATVTEKAVYKYKIAMCTYKYTITRKMSGPVQPST